ncbi:MAG: uL30 family ribosomal protein [Candidatus Micrarchaeia archaeon]|jgi:large subunit ribosomal protein L30
MAAKKEAKNATPATGAIIAVRVRGHAQTRAEVEETLAQLGLSRKNHCVIVPNTPQNAGMVAKAKDFIAYGPADEQTVKSLVAKTPALAQKVADLVSGKTSVSKEGAKRVFRLKPPRKGFGQIKQAYPIGGIGNWGKDISKLVQLML